MKPVSISTTRPPRGAPATEPLEAWLRTLPVSGEFPCISEPRRYQHEESEYDAQYHNEPLNLSCGQGLVNLAREGGVETNGPALEIGCGTGLMSLGLVQQRVFPAVLLTDPSPAFLRLTAQKLRFSQVPTDRVRFGLLLGEDTDRLPPDMFSLIALRSTLHHVLDVDRFLAHAARALRPGGALVFEEPCMEGYVLMGALAQFLPALCAATEKPLTGEQRKRVELFVHTMHFYARRDLDKSAAEDKHLFRVDELMASAREAGLTLEFKPNQTYYHFGTQPAKRRGPQSFKKFFREYLQYCMGFDDPLLELFDEQLGPYCNWLDSLCAADSPPYLNGVFLARRN